MIILGSDKVNFKVKIVSRDKEVQFITIKVSTHQEVVIVINTDLLSLFMQSHRRKNMK